MSLRLDSGEWIHEGQQIGYDFGRDCRQQGLLVLGHRENGFVKCDLGSALTGEGCLLAEKACFSVFHLATDGGHLLGRKMSFCLLCS
jgi:hypothetical protein